MPGNDVRIVLEGFCKDIVDVIVAKLGYHENEVWKAVAERDPDYRPSRRQANWASEVARLVLGPGIRLIKALAPLAFSEKRVAIDLLVETLGKLGKLNSLSHHNEGVGHGSTIEKDVPELVSQAISQAHEIVGELPWHMKADLIYGEHPGVISGTAWSHSYSTPRVLRVIVWDGSARGTQVRVWNESGRNPVIADPVFITRPGS